MKRPLSTAVIVGFITVLAGFTPAAAASPLARSGVLTVADDCLPPPPAMDPGTPWAQQRLAPQRAWELTRGAGVTVAVVDTGVDARSPQLAGRVQRGSDVVAGKGSADTDCYGHGTFIAGIIAAGPADGTGFVGIAPAVTIVPIRIANNANDGSATVLGQGIRAAVDAGATVINVSATTTVSDPSLVQAIEYAAAHDVVVVASAANERTAQPAVTVYPAALPSVLAVGAIDVHGNLASFSQTAPYLAMVAPGVEVVSIGPGGPGHWQGSGTSYATAFVSGVAALVRAYRPGLSAAQVLHRLQATADHPAAALPDPGAGWGVVNPLSAVATVLPEEGAAGVHRGPLPGEALKLPEKDLVGPSLMMLGAGAVVILAGTASLLAVLLPAGRRRGWRPARTARVSADEREPALRPSVLRPSARRTPPTP